MEKLGSAPGKAHAIVETKIPEPFDFSEDPSLFAEGNVLALGNPNLFHV